MAIFCKNFVQTESQKYQNYAFIFWMILIKIQTTMILSWKCEHIIIRQKSFAECQKSKQPIIQYLKCWEDKTKKSYNITLKSRISTPPPLSKFQVPTPSLLLLCISSGWLRLGFPRYQFSVWLYFCRSCRSCSVFR